MPGFQVCFSDQTGTHTHTHTHARTSFFHFRARWVWVLNATPWPLYPRKEIRYPFIWLDTSLVWTAVENRMQAGIESVDSPGCTESLFLCREYGSLEEKRVIKLTRNILHRLFSKFAFQIKTSHRNTQINTHLSFILALDSRGC